MATYKGTRVTGTSSSAKVFAKSGVKSASVGETYLNTSTGHVYQCTEKGGPSKAKWKYHHTNIVKKPSITVKGLGSPTRASGGSYVMQAAWKVPSALVSKKKGDRATALMVTWSLGIPGTGPKDWTQFGNENRDAGTVNLNNFKADSTGKTYRRTDFYPLDGKPKLSYVTCSVRPYNVFTGDAKKKRHGGAKTASATRKFTTPKAPTISALTFNENDDGHLRGTITTDPGQGYAERYDTRYQIQITNTLTNKTYYHKDTHSTSTSISIDFDASDYMQLDYSQYIRVYVKAWARGFAGDSKAVERTFYVSWPARATITDVKASGKGAQDKCTVLVKTNTSAAHPVDVVQLGYIANTTYSKASQIPADEYENATWTDVRDNGDCTALAYPVGNLIPAPGRFTWVLLKTMHTEAPALFRYSEPARVTRLETPAQTAADDVVQILSVEPGADGTSADVTLGWNADGKDDSTGTELSWADAENAWRSNDGPKSLDFEWSDGSREVGGKTYRDSASLCIKGLAGGEAAYFRARRYMDGDATVSGRTEYGPYSDTASVIPSVAPSDVVLVVPGFVAAGSPLPLSWTFAGGGAQRAWRVVRSDGTIIDGESNGLGSCEVSAERVAALASNGALGLHVEVSTGGTYAASDDVTVRIVEAPTLAVAMAATTTAQPVTFTATSNAECRLTYELTADGTDDQRPDGLYLQPAGDSLASGVVNPAWAYDEAAGTYSATVTLKGGLDLIDKGAYSLACVAEDTATGLRSAPATAGTKVLWGHQAPVLDGTDCVTAEGLDWYDEETGFHHQQAQITMTPPEGAADTDRYEVYRLTPDGAVLIGRNYPLTSTVVDDYAPFGLGMALAYRVAIRTADGDVEWVDAEYDLDAEAMRFDFPEGSLELPHDIAISDGYAKNASVVTHLDGSVAAHYRDGVTREGTLTTRMIRLEEQTDVALVRRLGRFAGDAYVRLPDGSAYQAKVELTEIGGSGVLLDVSLSATEITTTAAYMLPSPNTEDQTTGGSGEGTTDGS